MALKGKAGTVFMENVKVQITDNRDYTYPDIFITTDDSDTDSPYIKRHPILILEVLSDSTRTYDKTEKFTKRYQKIESLHYYMTVEPEKTVVEFHVKDEKKKWATRVFTEFDEQIALPLLDISVSLYDLYV